MEFLNDLRLRLPDESYRKTTVTVRAKAGASYPESTLEAIADADAIVFVFPLHNYGLPGALMRLLEDFYQYAKTGKGYNKAAKVYMIVNCAFPRSEKTTGEAVRVIQNFCRRLSLDWRFAVCIGTGPVVVVTKRIPFTYRKLKKAYAEIASDIRGEGKTRRQSYFIKPIIPESIIAMIKRHYEKTGKMYD